MGRAAKSSNFPGSKPSGYRRVALQTFRIAIGLLSFFKTFRVALLPRYPGFCDSGWWWCSSDYFVSTQLQLCLFCRWDCGCYWAVTIGHYISLSIIFSRKYQLQLSLNSYKPKIHKFGMNTEKCFSSKLNWSSVKNGQLINKQYKIELVCPYGLNHKPVLLLQS